MLKKGIFDVIMEILISIAALYYFRTICYIHSFSCCIWNICPCFSFFFGNFL